MSSREFSEWMVVLRIWSGRKGEPEMSPEDKATLLSEQIRLKALQAKNLRGRKR